MDKGDGLGSGGGADELAGFGERGEGNGQAMLQSAREFWSKSGAEKKNGLADSSAAELGALGDKGDGKLLTSSLGEGTSNGDETVAIGVIFNYGENLGFGRKRTAYRAEVVAEGRKGNLAPGANIAGNFHWMRIKGGKEG